jgi:tRNA A-37 threonylcarbamoyl transferase component Bud32
VLTFKYADLYSVRVLENSPRSLRHNHAFHHWKTGGFCWLVRRAWLDDNLRELLGNPDRYLENLTGLPPGDWPSTSVARVSTFFLKRYNRASPAKMFKSIFRIAPAHRAFCLAHHLEQVGIPTPRVLAVANKRIARVLLRSYLVTENIQYARTLEQCEGVRIRAALAAASLLARLHDEGFIHRDLNPRNLLFDQNRRLLFVDLDTMRYVHRVTEDRALHDLARFSRQALLCAKVSRTDRARFLKEYCRLRRTTNWRSCWNRIAELDRAEFARLARKSDTAVRRELYANG